MRRALLAHYHGWVVGKAFYIVVIVAAGQAAVVGRRGAAGQIVAGVAAFLGTDGGDGDKVQGFSQF